jgi:hypothetical protein
VWFSSPCVLTVRGTPELSRVDEIVEHDPAGRDPDTEQSRGLIDVECEARHFPIGAEDHRVQDSPIRFARRRASDVRSPIGSRTRKRNVIIVNAWCCAHEFLSNPMDP